MRLSNTELIEKDVLQQDFVLCWRDGNYMCCDINMFNVDSYYWYLLTSFMDGGGLFAFANIILSVCGHNYTFLIKEKEYVEDVKYVRIRCRRTIEDETEEMNLMGEIYTTGFELTIDTKSNGSARLKILV